MEHLLTFENLIALVTLTSLEVVLGIDNVVLLAVMSSKLEPSQQPVARRVGLVLAMVMRLVLLLFISRIIQLSEPLFAVIGHEVSGRDLVLLIGGIFLIGKATTEVHDNLEGEKHEADAPKGSVSFRSVIAHIVVMDIVFSLDSVITAVGMVDEIAVMMAAVVIAVGIMLAFAGIISTFIERHPTLKMLAISFMLLVGVVLVAEGAGQHIERGYIYFAMAFSLAVEVLNIRVRAVSEA